MNNSATTVGDLVPLLAQQAPGDKIIAYMQRDGVWAEAVVTVKPAAHGAIQLVITRPIPQPAGQTPAAAPQGSGSWRDKPSLL